MIQPSEGLFLGLMSGTSVDGIDVALIRRKGQAVKVVATATSPWPTALRQALLDLARGKTTGDAVDELGRLDCAVGDTFAAAAASLLTKARVAASRVKAIGSHGQTVRHRPKAGFSIQIGDPARIARETGITTIADFRRADLAAGGQGAPLAPILHRTLFAAAHESRAVLNLGGIANLTLLLPDHPVVAFDVGPANTLLDALARETTGDICDRDGRLAASGRVAESLLGALLSDPWFSRDPPKSTGPELFNLAWVRKQSEAGGLSPQDLATTLTEFVVLATVQALARSDRPVKRLYVCGGGVHNPELMRRLAARLPDIELATTAALGLDPDYVEAVCFAWLAGETLAGRPGNLPEVTGARGSVILGCIHHP